MTQRLTRATMVMAFCGLVTACATPSYPTHDSAPAAATPAPPSQPPATQPPPTPAPAAQAAAAQPTPAPAAPAVESQPLPPVPDPTTAAPPRLPPVPDAAPAVAAPEPEAPAPRAAAERWTPPSAPVRQQTTIHYLAGGKVVAAKGMYRDYVVEKKDHVDAIARDLQTTRAVIVDANHLRAPYRLQPGEHLKIPVEKAYEAQAGDSLTVIAKRFGVGLGELAALNDLPTHGRLQQGEKIALPANFHDRGPTQVRTAVEVARAAPAAAPKPSPAPYRAYAASPSAPPRPAPAVGAAAPTPYIAHPYTPSAPAVRPVYAPITPPITSGHVATDSEIATAAKGRFIWPLQGVIISGFGSKGVGRRNDGVDVRAPQGAVVHAAAAGEVVYAGDQVPGFGNLVLVKHADGWVTAYAHLDKLSVQMRQTVMQGQEIGQAGSTGGVTEPQLHFEVRYAPSPAEKAKPVDPILVLPKREG